MSAAAPGAPSAWLIADTTPLMTAIYSQQVFGDDALLAEGLAFQRLQVDVTLLLGLDLPWVPDGLQRDGAQVVQNSTTPANWMWFMTRRISCTMACACLAGEQASTQMQRPAQQDGAGNRDLESQLQARTVA